MRKHDDGSGRSQTAQTPSRRAARAVEKARQSNRDWAGRNARGAEQSWRRESWVLPRAEARAVAREFLRKYPRAAYWSEVESWRVLPDDRIEFTMRRLPSAD